MAKKSSPSKAVMAQMQKNASTSVKKIENGFLVTKEMYKPNGQYETKQYYTPTNPLERVINKKAKS